MAKNLKGLVKNFGEENSDAKNDLADEIRELNKRIGELEKTLSALTQPFVDLNKTTGKYLKLTGLLLEYGGLTPDLIFPEIKDPISKEIVRVLMDRSEQNISQITELVRSKRGTASRRIVREKIEELMEKNIVQKHQKRSRYVYRVTEEVIKKWLQMLGFDI